MEESIIKNYLQLNTNVVFTDNFSAFQPSPNEQDYRNEFIYRYFIRKRNQDNGLIYEVSADTFTDFENNQLYFGTKIKWKITGQIDEVSKLNQRSVAFGKQTLSNLDTHIKNYTKFWKG
jgi:hypothetical protein